MRFLIDEMFPTSAAVHLRELHHDAVHLREIGFNAVDDALIAEAGRSEERAVVTENVVDFARERDVVLVFVRKDGLPAGSGQGAALARLLDGWARANPEPYLGPHWPREVRALVWAHTTCCHAVVRPVPRDLAELRLEAERAMRAEDWAAYAALVARLRERDTEWWPHLWAPMAAVAVLSTGGDPVPLLAEAVDLGFRQPDMLPLERDLGDLSEWPGLLSRMRQPARPAAYEILEWPSVDYGPELVLDRLPAGEEERLRAYLPTPRDSAWATARELLAWSTTRWEHANDHVDSANALEVLDRVAAGERFACVEYSALLSQGLNAVGIPARRVSLRMADAHVGFGRGHVVSEAWIDDLGRWVVLDGQNGSWWGSTEEPLGLLELIDLHRSSAPRPEMVLTERQVSSEDQDDWWSYFDSASSSGLFWIGPDRPLVPVFQSEAVSARLVVGTQAVTHPDLAQLETATVDVDGRPGVVFSPVHPFACGVHVADIPVSAERPYDLAALSVGTHRLEVTVDTPYGCLAAQPLVVTRRAR